MTDRTNRGVKYYCAALYGLTYIVLGTFGLASFFGVEFFSIIGGGSLLIIVTMIVIAVVTKQLTKKLWFADIVTVLFDWVLDLAGGAGMFYLIWHDWHWQLIAASLSALIALAITRWLRRLNPDTRKWEELLEDDLSTKSQ